MASDPGSTGRSAGPDAPPQLGLILAIFILSGAAGLVYEVVWSRQLVLVFGNTTEAVSAILTGFFGGMAIGSAIGGRLADRVARPLRLYAMLEVGLAVVVLLTPAAFRVIDGAYGVAFASVESNPFLLVMFRFGLALAALGPATMLMGATLPTLTRYLSSGSAPDLASAFSRLYAANTIGGIVGAAAAGLVLIEVLGLTGALAAGVCCTLTAGSVALMVDRGAATAAPRVMPAARIPWAALSRSRVPLALGLAFASGLTSLGYQVLWNRLLAAGTGNSTYVFTVILVVFLSGLAIGATYYARRRDVLKPIPLIAFGQVATSLFATAGMVFILHGHVIAPLSAATPLSATFGLFLAATIVVVLPTTTMLGLTFPATSALLDGPDGLVGAESGLLLASNTVGAICGTFLVPFVLIPAVGSPVALGLMAALNAAIGLGLHLTAPSRGHRTWTLGTLVPIVAVVIVGSSLATGKVFEDPTASTIVREGGKVFGRAEDEIAPVVSGEVGGSPQLWVTGTSMTLLTVDTKLMPALPLMARPGSTHALVIAFGMGSAFRSSLIDGLATDAVELVPSVPKMFPFYYPDAAKWLDDPRGHIYIADGRNFAALTDRTYDIVIVDPPPPIESSGVSVISSLEFYEAVHERLAPGGVMMQWIPYGQTVDEFRSHVRTFHAVYPNVLIAFGPGGNGMYMLGSDSPITLVPGAIRSVLSRPGVLADLSSAFDSPRGGLAAWEQLVPGLVWIQGEEVDRFGGTAPLITDDRPLPEYFLLRHLFGAPSQQVSRAALLSIAAALSR